MFLFPIPRVRIVSECFRFHKLVEQVVIQVLCGTVQMLFVDGVAEAVVEEFGTVVFPNTVVTYGFKAV